MANRCFMHLNQLVQDIGDASLRRGIEREVSQLASYVAGLLTDQRVLEERNRRLLYLSRCDEVTGLYNQRYFMERLDEEFRRALRYAAPLSLLMADLDEFKAFNDRQGHPAGNELLREVAEVIRQTARATDIAARFGGDEFAILLPQTTGEQGMHLAERLRTAVAALPENASISVGVASLSGGISGAPELVAKADRAMYRAKAQGRNRVIGRTS